MRERGLPWSWNATAADRLCIYGCDAVIPRPQHVLFRAVDVDAPPALVFRWLQQLRIAPYSYDWVDNFLLPSPRRLTARADPIAPGQRFMHVARIVAVEPERAITAEIVNPLARALLGDLAGTYAVDERPGGARLCLKVNAIYPRSLYGRAIDPILPWIDLAMSRKQLLRLKRYAERDARADRRVQRG